MEKLPDPPAAVSPHQDQGATLPPLYQRWVAEILDEIPAEPEATCLDCPMVSRSGEQEGVFFNPVTKCCTYRPNLPNYLENGLEALGIDVTEVEDRM